MCATLNPPTGRLRDRFNPERDRQVKRPPGLQGRGVTDDEVYIGGSFTVHVSGTPQGYIRTPHEDREH